MFQTPLRQTWEPQVPQVGRNTQRQLSAGSVQVSPFAPLPWWLSMEHVFVPPLPPPLQLPQSVAQLEQVSLPLQVPSPHFGVVGGGLEPQLPQAEQLLLSEQQSPYWAQESSHQHPLVA